MLLPKPIEAYQMLNFLLTEEGEKFNNWSFTFKGIFWHTQTIQTLKTGLNVASPWIFVGLISILWSTCVLPRPLMC